jgi:membrane protease YdiL (CAAX protease family)
VSGAFASAGFALFALSLTPHASAILESSWFSWTASYAETIIFSVIVFWIVGKAGTEIIRSSIRASEAKYLFLAAAFSIGIGVLISTGQYVLDRSHWAATQFGNSAPPQIWLYFNFPDPLLFLMFFSALFEEVVFRGLVQTFFVRRYGQYRGIFLTGIVWAAFHFNSDALLHPNELGALSQLGFRLAMCLALGFVLSWLTLRSGSVLPAAIAHTFYNILVSNFGLAFPGKSMVWVALWAVLACILFRYWPVQPLIELAVETTSAEPGIAI